MDYMLGTRCEPCTVKISISSLKTGVLHLQIIDLSYANTVLADRVIVVGSTMKYTWYIPLPISPWKAIIRINENSQRADNQNAFLVLEIEKMALHHYPSAIEWSNKEVRQAIILGQRFCYNAGWLPTISQNQAYCSPDRSLKIQYFPLLIDPTTKRESVTPMRISDTTNIIEVSQKKCLPFTVEGRLVMFFHEVSHKYENEDPDWELEADLNGLTIYLALGYSKYEAIQVYEQVFSSVPSEENVNRLGHIKQFINEFENHYNYKNVTK